jgi:hypothetical protein
MRDANRLVRHWRGLGRGGALAGVGCLISLLCGCVPAVVVTGAYLDKRDQAGEPAQVYAPSSGQTQADRPLLTTKNYRDPTEGGQGSTQVYRATLDQVWVAALKALSQLQANVTSNTRGQTGGRSRDGGSGGSRWRCTWIRPTRIPSGSRSGSGNSGTGRPRMSSRPGSVRTSSPDVRRYSALVWCLCALVVRRKRLGYDGGTRQRTTDNGTGNCPPRPITAPLDRTTAR